MLIHFSRTSTTQRLLPLVALSILVVGSLLPLSSGLRRTPSGVPSLPQGMSLSDLPLRFEPNTGLFPSSVHFTARSPQSLLEFTPSNVRMTLQAGAVSPESRVQSSASQSETPSTLRIEFLGANPQAETAGNGPSAATVNYFLGSDPAAWRTGLPTYAGITYSSLYPGIDLQYEGTGGQLKSTYLVAPNADPSAIRWRYSGANNVTIDSSGNLQINIANSKVKTQDSKLTQNVELQF